VLQFSQATLGVVVTPQESDKIPDEKLARGDGVRGVLSTLTVKLPFTGCALDVCYRDTINTQDTLS
jgi:hypothetical protein